VRLELAAPELAEQPARASEDIPQPSADVANPAEVSHTAEISQAADAP